MSEVRKHFDLAITEFSVLLVFLLSTKNWSMQILQPVNYLFYSVLFIVLLIISNHWLLVNKKNIAMFLVSILIGVVNSFFCLCISAILFQQNIIVFLEKVLSIGMLPFLGSYIYRSLLLGWWILPFLILLTNKIIFNTKSRSNT